MLRDQELNWPWYDGSVTAVRKSDPELDATSLHYRLVDTLKQHAHYATPIQAACDIDVASLLSAIGGKLIVATRDEDCRYAPAAGVAGPKVPRPGSIAARASAFAKALAP